MARVHGKEVRAYLGSRDISGDVGEISPKLSAQVHDRTTFADAGNVTYDAGLREWQAAFTGFYDPAAGGFGRQLEDVGVGTAGLMVLSVYDGDADAIGDSGILFSEAVLETRDQPMKVTDLVKVTGTLRGNGRVGYFGKLLHPKGDETVTGVESSLDNTASSANGGRGTIHVHSVTGTWTIKIQHSTDNSSWSDLITFTAFTAAGCQTVEVSGTVNRYLRITSTEDVAGTINFTAGFARY